MRNPRFARREKQADEGEKKEGASQKREKYFKNSSKIQK